MYELHGDTGTRLHRIWKGMKCRCFTPNYPPYKYYGARGITVCSEWKESYLSFKNWAVNNGYADNLELDRINVNGNYCPENCQWITHHEQTMNRRDTLYVIVDGEQYKLRDFCEQKGVSISTVVGWRHKGQLTTKLKERFGEVIIYGGREGGW